MQRRPETIARTREVVADGGGVKPGVDADEQDVEVGRDDVTQGLIACRE